MEDFAPPKCRDALKQERQLLALVGPGRELDHGTRKSLQRVLARVARRKRQPRLHEEKHVGHHRRIIRGNVHLLVQLRKPRVSFLFHSGPHAQRSLVHVLQAMQKLCPHVVSPDVHCERVDFGPRCEEQRARSHRIHHCPCFLLRLPASPLPFQLSHLLGGGPRLVRAPSRRVHSGRRVASASPWRQVWWGRHGRSRRRAALRIGCERGAALHSRTVPLGREKSEVAVGLEVPPASPRHGRARALQPQRSPHHTQLQSARQPDIGVRLAHKRQRHHLGHAQHSPDCLLSLPPLPFLLPLPTRSDTVLQLRLELGCLARVAFPLSSGPPRPPPACLDIHLDVSFSTRHAAAVRAVSATNFSPLPLNLELRRTFIPVSRALGAHCRRGGTERTAGLGLGFAGCPSNKSVRPTRMRQVWSDILYCRHKKTPQEAACTPAVSRLHLRQHLLPVTATCRLTRAAAFHRPRRSQECRTSLQQRLLPAQPRAPAADTLLHQ